MQSFPTRERGLKPRVTPKDPADSAVVPYAGTWIETLSTIPEDILEKVVPYAGTWIETLNLALNVYVRLLSFPTRERGLKPYKSYNLPGSYLSFPTRERGLKLPVCKLYVRLLQSFPTRERGLKLAMGGSENSKQ